MALSAQVASTREFTAFKTVAKRYGFVVSESWPEDKPHAAWHTPGSWHMQVRWYLGRRRSLGADFNKGTGPYNPVEKAIVTRLIPVARSMGVALRYSYYGHVADHDDHLHADAGTWQNLGTGERRVSPGDLCVWDVQKLLENTQDNLLHTVDTRDLGLIRSVARGNDPGNQGTKLVQGIVDTTVDGDIGPKTLAATKKWVVQFQKVLKTYGFYKGTNDGIWGPKMEAAYNQFLRVY